MRERKSDAGVQGGTGAVGRQGRESGTLGVPGVEREIGQERVRQARGKRDRAEPGEQRKPSVRAWCDLKSVPSVSASVRRLVHQEGKGR